MNKTNTSSQKVDFLTVGGGLGSFITIDALRISGMSKSSVAALGPNQHPYQEFATKCINSGISLEDRLRSDSAAVPGNIWGWPSFGSKEIIENLKRGKLHSAASLGTRLFFEPIYFDHFTPKLRHLIDSVEKEAERIDYPASFTEGMAEAACYDEDEKAWRVDYKNNQDQTNSIMTKYLHLALGSGPARKDKIAMQAEQLKPADYSHIYEAHEFIISRLSQEGGTIVVRGRGIAASRLIDRLITLNKSDIKILHLMNDKIDTTKLIEYRNRSVQPFNYPKTFFGGENKLKAEKMPFKERVSTFKKFSGTTTPNRRDWRQNIDRACEDGRYQALVCKITTVAASSESSPFQIKAEALDKSCHEFSADFIVDAIGTDNKPSSHPFVKSIFGDQDLMIEPDFSSKAHPTLFISGSYGAKGYFGPVDSFSGLNYAAIKIAHAVVKEINGKKPKAVKNASQWTRRAIGVEPA